MVSSILSLNQLIRFHFFGFSSSVALLGVAAVNGTPSLRQLIAVLGATFAFHVFAYVQNDVIDLEVDRTQALRQDDLLITGRVAPSHAMAAALLQLPVSLLLVWWGGAPYACSLVVLAGFALMTIYNLYGKRCPFPPATDMIQGLGWGTLALMGALVAGGRLSWLAVLAAAHGAGFLFLINGVHGGLRDLGNDLRCGMKTTAIYYGAQPLPGGGALSSRGVQRFAWLALAVLVGPSALAFAGNLFGYDDRTWWLVFVPWAALQLVSVAVLRRVVAPIEARRGFIISAHGLPLLLPPIVAFLPLMSARLALTTLLCFFAPFVAMDPGLESVRALLRRGTPATGVEALDTDP